MAYIELQLYMSMKSQVMGSTPMQQQIFGYSTKEPGSSAIVRNFHKRGSIDWRTNFYRYCANSKILQNVAK